MGLGITLDSSNKSVDKIVDRYSQLFTLPSHKVINLSLFISCLVGGLLVTLPLISSLYGVFLGLVQGIFAFLVTLLVDFGTTQIFMKDDPILNLRRCSFLSFSSCLVLFIFIFFANLTSVSFGSLNLLVKLSSLGFFVALTLRLLVFSTVSSVNYWRVFFSAFLQPTLLLVILFLIPSTLYNFIYQFSSFLVSIIAAIFGVQLFNLLLNRIGKEFLGIPSISLFKVFLANWTEGLNKPIEEVFEQLGNERDIIVSLLALKANNRLEAIIVVPNVHPGPFKNIGSSALPSMIQKTLEDKLQCVVSVPHGISGHDLDLTSQIQNEKILNGILNFLDFNIFDSKATPFIRINEGSVNASCQIFGRCALFTLTTAPKTMEDLPTELYNAILQKSNEMGLSSIVIDAHNSVNGSFKPEEITDYLGKAALSALEKAVHSRYSHFEIGVAKVVPEEFGIKDGMGPGGITVIIVKVGDQKAAYITIDGNNMVSNLRENILLRLGELGITDGEVLTSDTHIVNGVVMVKRGYHPIGEVINTERLIGYIESAVLDALEDLEIAEAAWRTEIIPKIKVIGEEQINTLSLIAERTAKQAKKYALLIFPLISVALTALLILL